VDADLAHKRREQPKREVVAFRRSRRASSSGRAMTSVQIREPAPAKVNLFLHLLGRRADGYHRLESLVAFADVHDVVELDVAPMSARAHESESVIVTGPFASALHEALESGARLTVETAYEIARAAARPRCFQVDVTLVKNLPVAAGLGGGSADGAAALRGLARAFELGWGEAETREAALGIGADAPACVASRPLMMRGIGEEIAPLALWPDLDVVLVNPGRPLMTASVFKAFAEQRRGFSAPHPPPPATRDPRQARAYLAGARNDLHDAAASLEPAVEEILALLQGVDGARLARLSGSGATCWAAFDDAPSARRAADEVKRLRPAWWVEATRLQGTG
jgi:4-diphosphocytidyl-2-C-methyl-D-erythritol kinase